MWESIAAADQLYDQAPSLQQPQPQNRPGLLRPDCYGQAPSPRPFAEMPEQEKKTKLAIGIAGCTGADISAICNEAGLAAVRPALQLPARLALPLASP